MIRLDDGRRVHLLGGSWKKQLAYMKALGDDVVSLDNNYILKMAKYAQFVYPDGETGSLDKDLNMGRLTNPYYVALTLTFGAIGVKIQELYGGN